MKKTISILGLAFACVAAFGAASNNDIEKVVHSYNSVALLLNINPNIPDNCVVAEGLQSTGDGGGGVLRYYPTDTTTTNESTVFKPYNYAGRWWMILGPGTNAPAGGGALWTNNAGTLEPSPAVDFVGVYGATDGLTLQFFDNAQANGLSVNAASDTASLSLGFGGSSARALLRPKQDTTSLFSFSGNTGVLQYNPDLTSGVPNFFINGSTRVSGDIVEVYKDSGDTLFLSLDWTGAFIVGDPAGKRAYIAPNTSTASQTPYTWDTAIAHTTGRIQEWKNDGTNMASISVNGALSTGTATNQWIFKQATVGAQTNLTVVVDGVTFKLLVTP